jgi:uncharacterized protein
VILVDANLVIYAHDLSSPFHEPARRWLENVFSGPELVGIPLNVALAFLRITTNPKVFKNPFSIEEASAIVESWFLNSTVSLVQPGERHLRILLQLLREAQVRGPLVMDAHLAALAIEHRATLCSFDSDFSGFSGLVVHNPLAP